jgi:hypothetical protein
MVHNTRKRAVFSLVALLACLVLPSFALAHERREVGKYDLVVGWAGEPAFVGEKNGIDLRVSLRPESGQQTEARPIEGLEKTLKAEIIFGGQRRELELRAVFRQPGAYTADVLPMREGDYRFRFFGTIEGNEVNETFDSADGKFNAVKPIQGIQFPEVAAAATAPQTTQAVQTAQRAAADAQAATAMTQVLAIAALALGGLSLVLGALALGASRRTAAPADRPSSVARASHGSQP